jgi:type IV secretory pathway VirB10-like protein
MAGDHEARRQAAREEKQKVLGSPILVELENPTAAEQNGAPPAGVPNATLGGPAAAVGGPQAQPGGLGSAADPNMQQRKNDFLSHDGVSSSSYLSEAPTAPRSPYEVKAGTVLPTTLITGIDSDLPGQIVGQVRENVYDTVTGNYLLVPQGSRLIATYDSMVGFGQERVLVCWNRLIRPDGVSITLECMPGVDLAGYAGFADDVDHHWWRILSGVALGTLLSATAQRSQGDVTGYQPTMPQLWASNAAGTINQAGQQITQKNLQIQPTIKVRPGYSVNVLVTKDIILSPYRR